MPRLMLAGVRVGGAPWWPTPFRWGYGWPWPRTCYGWPWPRTYRAQTASEQQQVAAMLAIQPQLKAE